VLKKIIIIKTGNTFSNIADIYGDFEDWIAKSLGIESSKIKIVDVPKKEPLPDINECQSVVIAGSHAMVTDDLEWSIKIESWVPLLIEKKIPVIGICYGHQLIAKAMGGKVGYHPEGMELGTKEIFLNKEAKTDLLFTNMPHSFKAHVSHSQSVIKLPADSVLLASNAFEKHHAFRIGESAWGVQFHPEYDSSIMKSYIKNMAKQANKIKVMEKALIDNTQETSTAAMVMERFGKLSA